MLDEYGVRATFFVVSAWAEQYPDTAKAIVAHGHELMNHSSKHDHYNSLSAEQIVADANKCNDAIESLTGVRPTLIRCPFGEYDDHVISALRSMGMEPIQWDVERSRTASSADDGRVSRLSGCRRARGGVPSDRKAGGSCRGKICFFTDPHTERPTACRSGENRGRTEGSAKRRGKRDREQAIAPRPTFLVFRPVPYCISKNDMIKS